MILAGLSGGRPQKMWSTFEPLLPSADHVRLFNFIVEAVVNEYQGKRSVEEIFDLVMAATCVDAEHLFVKPGLILLDGIAQLAKVNAHFPPHHDGKKQEFVFLHIIAGNC